MKVKLITSVVIILLFSFIGSGCTKEEDVLVLQPEDQNTVLQKEVKGIEFSFSLLNEQGEAATVFNEGENFSFLFIIKNKTTEALPFYDYGFYTTNDFLAVRSASKVYGQPMKFVSVSTTKEMRWILPEGSAGFTIPWHEERSEFPMMHGYFQGLKQPGLPKGKYYTQFSYNFTFGLPDKAPEIETGKMTFRIDFEIK